MQTTFLREYCKFSLIPISATETWQCPNAFRKKKNVKASV